MAVVYSLFVHSLSLFLSVLVPPRWRFRPSSSLRLAVYQTPCQHQRTNTPRAFLNILFTPRLLFFFASILVSRACLFLAPLLLRRFELIIDAPWILPAPPCSAPPSLSLFSFFWIIFPNGFFFASRFYRPDSLSMRSTSRFYLSDLSSSIPMFYPWCFGGYGRGFVFTIREEEGKGERI